MNSISLIFTFAFVFIGAEASSNRIIGGSRVSPNAIPYLVSIQSGGKHICGGSILNENYVITAARCVEEPDDLSVVAGEHNLEDDSGNEQNRGTEDIIVNEYYFRRDASFGPHDIALIKVDEPFEFNDRVKAVNLPEKKDTYPAGTGISAGWGNVGGILGIPKETDVVHKVELDIQTQRKCLDDYDWDLCSDRYVCAGSSSKRLCAGDIGGPLAQEEGDDHTLVGIATYAPCGSLGLRQNLFVQVSRYLDWINEKLEG